MKHSTQPRQRKSIEEVTVEVAGNPLLSPLYQQFYQDGDWIWYCGPSLAGESNKPIRDELKSIGFRFAPNGHLMPDNQTVGTWGHSCMRPTFKKHKPPAKRVSPQALLEDL